MCGQLDCYLDRFSRLATNRDLNCLPEQTNKHDCHEQLLLLAVLDLIASGNIIRNFIEISPLLEETFNNSWRKLIPGHPPGNIASPFCSLANTAFWHLRPRSGSPSKPDSDIKTVDQLRANYFGAIFNDDLFPLLQMDPLRNKLKKVLLEQIHLNK